MYEYDAATFGLPQFVTQKLRVEGKSKEGLYCFRGEVKT